ncbi:MAG: sodium/proline symporter [Luteitalea sp.]|nr:sodium/proline symporter [Luteitalea sp.]
MAIILTGFVTFLLLFTLIGVASTLKKQETTEDYLLAGRNVNPWLTALSAVATNNSGFMFMGMIGFTYALGIQTVWMMVGWITGELIAWIWVHKRVRIVSGQAGVQSVPELVGSRPDGGVNRPVVVLGGVLTFSFLSVYAAAQLQAGGVALHAVFDRPEWIGSVIGAIVVIAYCYAGGLRASIWTDAAQSVVMLGTMIMLLGFAAAEVGAPSALFAALGAEDPSLLEWRPTHATFGLGMYLIGMVSGGFSSVGQPHILIRILAIESPKAIDRARIVYFSWYIPFFLLVIAIALYARVLVPGLEGGANEGALLELGRAGRDGQPLLPSFLVGVLLAGIFAATISTADSQLLACSAAVTRDIWPRAKSSYLASKLATLSVAAIALAIALTSSEGVFELVLRAVSLFGASFVPLLLLRLAQQPVSSAVGLAMMVVGAGTVLVWEFGLYPDAIYPALLGMTASTLTYLVCRKRG